MSSMQTNDDPLMAPFEGMNFAQMKAYGLNTQSVDWERTIRPMFSILGDVDTVHCDGEYCHICRETRANGGIVEE